MDKPTKRKIAVDVDPECWLVLEASAKAERRTLDDEISLRLIRSTAQKVLKPTEVTVPSAPPSIPEPIDVPESTGVVVQLGEVGIQHLRDAKRLEELNHFRTLGLVTSNGDGGYIGVYRHGRRWRAMAVSKADGRSQKRTVGSYETPEDAAIARAKFLIEDERRMEEELLASELRNGHVMRPWLKLHPAYEYWLHVECMADGVVELPPCPFEPGVRYTVDHETMAVTRDSDGAVIVPPNKYRRRLPS